VTAAAPARTRPLFDPSRRAAVRATHDRRVRRGGDCVTLEQKLGHAWETLLDGATTECPVCGGTLDRTGEEARCGGCGSTLA
jgi:tRNA(Ile2) C34 agmatinyltransferase TiaS